MQCVPCSACLSNPRLLALIYMHVTHHPHAIQLIAGLMFQAHHVKLPEEAPSGFSFNKYNSPYYVIISTLQEHYGIVH